jgi:hypothetical protein
MLPIPVGGRARDILVLLNGMGVGDLQRGGRLNFGKYYFFENGKKKMNTVKSTETPLITKN